MRVQKRLFFSLYYLLPDLLCYIILHPFHISTNFKVFPFKWYKEYMHIFALNFSAKIEKNGRILLNTIIAHGVSPCTLLYDLLSTFLLLNLFRLAITKGFNTYWLKIYQLFIFVLICKHFEKQFHFDIMGYCVCDTVTQHPNVFLFKFRL